LLEFDNTTCEFAPLRKREFAQSKLSRFRFFEAAIQAGSIGSLYSQHTLMVA
jgi:hypothetical protein